MSLNSDSMPDSHESNKDDYQYPGDEFVISRDNEGNVVSRYGQENWNLTSYSTLGPCQINYVSWSNEESCLKHKISQELKCLYYSILYHSKKAITVGTVRSHVSDLRRIAKISLAANCTIAESSTSKLFLFELKKCLSTNTRTSIQGVCTVYINLLEIQNRHPYLGLSFTSKPLRLLQEMISLIPKSSNQVPIIPSNIYSNLINKIRIYLAEFMDVSDSIQQLFETRTLKDPSYALSHVTSRGLGNLHQNSKLFYDALVELSIHEYCARNNIYDNRNLYSHLSQIQLACKWYIHIYSGMRDTEARTLPYDALEVITSLNGQTYVLNGYTSKLTGEGAIQSYWITSNEVNIAIKCAKTIADIIYMRNGISLSDHTQLPLFPAFKFQISTAHPGYGIPLAKLASDLSAVLLKNFDVRIEEEDIEELENFDGFRDWRSDPIFQVGMIWPFTTHQARRSLTVYAARSGVVSIGSLTLQLKHLTMAMTSYYMNNAAFAVNFVKNKSQVEFVAELNTQRKIAQFIHFDNEVINTSSNLFGGEGTRIQRIKDRGDFNVELDRELTNKQFNRGERSYRNTILGGCSLNEPCSKVTFTNVLTCTECSYSIFNDTSLERIEKAIGMLERKKLMFSKDSPSYCQLEREEVSLRAFLTRNLKE